MIVKKKGIFDDIYIFTTLSKNKYDFRFKIFTQDGGEEIRDEFYNDMIGDVCK